MLAGCGRMVALPGMTMHQRCCNREFGPIVERAMRERMRSAPGWATVTVTEWKGEVPEYELAVVTGGTAAVVPAKVTTVERVTSEEYKLEDGTVGSPDSFARGTITVTTRDSGGVTADFAVFVDEDEEVVGVVIGGQTRTNWAAKLTGVGKSWVPVGVLNGVVLVGELVPIAVVRKLKWAGAVDGGAGEAAQEDGLLGGEVAR